MSEAQKGLYPTYPVDPFSTVRDMFLQSTRKYKNKAALQHKKDGRWIAITYGELRDDVERIACGLAAAGLQPLAGKLAIVGDNRPEWAVSYLAAACTGIVCVPIDKDLKETEVYNILHLSGAQALICDDRHMDVVSAVRSRLSGLTCVVNMDNTPGEGTIPFAELRRLGCERIVSVRNDFEAASVTPDSLLSILFTSGTMGNSKGVMLTHGNVACNIVDAVQWVDLRGEDRFLSILPIHHSYECTDGFLLPLSSGATIFFAENLRRLAENMAETRTTAMLGVPLLWHAMYKKIEAGLAEKAWQVNTAKRLADFAERYLKLNIRRKLFAQMHARFGGCLRIFISGGAAVDPAVAKGFRELGIEFLQGYGLTESAPIITVNRNRAFRDDSAGLPLPSVDVRIAEDGEILARGPNIMVGYYNNPDATREALEDGWLHTGDLGYIDDLGFLYIQGRKKSVIVTPAGKKIYPEEVEAELLKSPCISECIVCGRAGDGDEETVEAIVVPDREHPAFIGLDEAGIERAVQKEVKDRCQKLASFKRVTKITVRFEELEKTTTKKIKRYLYTGKSPIHDNS